ncbi:MAG: GNAT family N-acetyltransferase [Pirellulaceae bacterium]
MIYTDSAPLTFHVHRTFDDASHLRGRWDDLAREHFMLQWSWLENWWQNFSAGPYGHTRRKLVLVSATAPDGQTVGIAPMYRESSLTGRSLRFAGDGSACTDYVRFITDPEWADAFYQGVGKWLAGREFRLEFGAVDWIEVDGHTDSEHGWLVLWNTLVSNGWRRQTRSIEGAWHSVLPNSWQEYYANLSKSRKRKVKKAERLRASGQVEFNLLSTPAEIESEWPVFVDLHQRRRQSLGQSGCFVNPRFESFLKNTMLDFSRDGQAHFARLSENNTAIGYLLLFENRGTISMYQSGFDPDAESTEPGHLINTFTARYAIEQQLKRYDFLRGDEGYKSGWNAENTPLFRTRCTSPQLASRVKNSIWNAGRTLKNWNLARTSNQSPSQ